MDTTKELMQECLEDSIQIDKNIMIKLDIPPMSWEDIRNIAIELFKERCRRP
jgi:Cft2 family RNA processing exonuclease